MMNKSTFSRRNFLRTTTATAAGLSVIPINFSYSSQKKKPNSKVNGVQLGLTTYSYLRIPHSLEEVLGYVLEAGVNAVEMRRVLEEGLGIPDGPPRRPRGPASPPSTRRPVKPRPHARSSACSPSG